MAGNGPAPKDPNRRARRNAAPNALRVVIAAPTEQPDLPSFDVVVKIDGEMVTTEFVWPERTREWWRMWGESPLSDDFTQTDWDFLLDTAVLHQALWHYGDMSVIAELRLRVAKFGATLEDRARLKMQFAEADKAEAKRPPVAPKTPAADPRSVLHAVG